MRAIDLAIKDLRQLVRDWKAATFLVAMPIVFTLIFGFAFGGFGGPTDPRLPVGFLDRDAGSILSPSLLGMIESSEVVRPVVLQEGADLDKQVHDGKLAAAIVVPAGYGERMLAGESVSLEVVVDPGSNAGPTVQAEVQAFAFRMASAVQAARLSADAYAGEAGFADEAARQSFLQEALGRALQSWAHPPLTVAVTASGAVPEQKGGSMGGFAHTSPAMMVQFAIAGVMAAGEILVLERKTRALQRLLTTAISRLEIIVGHFLTMFVMIFLQFVLLVVFGQIVLRLDYFREPLAVLLMMVTTALWAAAMGLLVGTLVKTQDQVILVSLLLMFILAALGGAWVPLEFTGPVFQAVGHFTPVAWAMDGFENIVVRGLGLDSVLLPAGILLAYAVVFFGLAAWRFRFE
jgi:ABC-2 type transport system permease protein